MVKFQISNEIEFVSYDDCMNIFLLLKYLPWIRCFLLAREIGGKKINQYKILHPKGENQYYCSFERSRHLFQNKSLIDRRMKNNVSVIETYSKT